jgi:hypothetical protein
MNNTNGTGFENDDVDGNNRRIRTIKDGKYVVDLFYLPCNDLCSFSVIFPYSLRV